MLICQRLTLRPEEVNIMSLYLQMRLFYRIRAMQDMHARNNVSLLESHDIGILRLIRITTMKVSDKPLIRVLTDPNIERRVLEWVNEHIDRPFCIGILRLRRWDNSSHLWLIYPILYRF